jgi:retron-type reverse transcriptase
MPQGAPTSPAISNLVCRRLDARLAGLAARNKGVYTRYADDLTFSFQKIKDLELGRFRWWVDQICHQEGFFVNQKKFRVIRASQRQLVTGLVVNDELRVPREARRRFRAILHNCRRHGIESQAQGRADFTAYLRGFASYVHMVHPEEGRQLLREVEELLGPEDAAEGEA